MQTSRSSRIALLIPVLLLVAVAYYAGRRHGRTEPLTEAATETPLAASLPATSVPAARPPAVPRAAVAEGDIAQARALGQAQLDASLARDAQRYAQERVDPAWADAKAQQLGSFADSPQMRELHATVRNLQVDCRTTLCRINGDFASRSAAEDWVMLYVTGVGSQMARASYTIKRATDGSASIEMYGNGR